MAKLPFVVLSATGEDAEYSAQELNTHASSTRGWQSRRFCDYPQELIFLVNRGENCCISQLQILSHEHKIPSKVEVFTGTGEDYATCAFQRLGFITFDSNEETNFQARELKSVKMNSTASFIKLILHPCHINKVNLFNQVGLVALNIVGEAEDLNYQAPSAEILPTQDDSRHFLADYSVTVDRKTMKLAQLMQLMQQQQNEAVSVEDFNHAMTIKAHEKALVVAAREMHRLTIEKKRAVLMENFESAKYIKIDIDAQQEIAQRIANIVYEEMKDFTIEHPDDQEARICSGALIHALPIDVPQGGIKQPSSSLINESAQKYLQGVPNSEGLPEPELVSNAILRDYGELILTFGEYVIRCTLSKHPSLREAALLKIKFGLNAEFESKTILPQLFVMIEIGLCDNNIHPFLAGCELLQGVMRRFVQIQPNVMQTELKPMIDLLLAKLGHVQVRIRDAAAVTVLSIADADHGGPVFLVSRLVKQVDESTSWRFLRGKLRILRAIVLEHHCGAKLSAKPIMQFMASVNAFCHANEKVREAARDLTVAVYRDIGRNNIEKYLGSLRQVQMDEYILAFNNDLQ